MAAQKIAGKKKPSSEPRLTSRQSKIFAAKQAEEKAQVKNQTKIFFGYHKNDRRQLKFFPRGYFVFRQKKSEKLGSSAKN